jgi:hypothetical protein
MTEPLQTRSGKHDISEEQRELNKQVREQITSIPDAKKINEEDLVYRFLIANKWDVPNTVQALKNYTDWRTSANIDNVTEETFPQEICETAMCGFHGVDKQGNPVYYDQPSQGGVRTLLKKFDIETLKRWHAYTMECARSLYKHIGKDRITIVMDLSGIGLSTFTDKKVMNLLKDNAKFDQEMYPEHLWSLYVINAASSFTFCWKILSAMLDERVLAKIKILGKDYHDELFQLIDKKHVPQDFGGHGGPLAHLKPGWKPENFHFHIVDAQQATSLEAYKLPVTGGSAPGGVANKSFNRKASCVTAGAKESLGELQWFTIRGLTPYDDSAVVGAELEVQPLRGGGQWRWTRNGRDVGSTRAVYQCTDADEGQVLGVVFNSSGGSEVFETEVLPRAPSICESKIAKCAVGEAARAEYQFSGGTEGNTACVWWRSRNGRFWHEIGIVGPGVPFDCGADDVLHYVKCIVVPQRNDGVQGGAVEMIAPCVLSKSCCQHVMSQVTSGSALYDVQLANGSAARLRLNHDGAEVTMVDRKNNRLKMLPWDKSPRISQSENSMEFFYLHVDHDPGIQMKATMPDMRAFIIVTFRVFQAMSTPTIARQLVDTRIAADWGKGKYCSEKTGWLPIRRSRTGESLSEHGTTMSRSEHGMSLPSASMGKEPGRIASLKSKFSRSTSNMDSLSDTDTVHGTGSGAKPSRGSSMRSIKSMSFRRGSASSDTSIGDCHSNSVPSLRSSALSSPRESVDFTPDLPSPSGESMQSSASFRGLGLGARLETAFKRFVLPHSAQKYYWRGPPHAPLDEAAWSYMSEELANHGPSWVVARDTMLAFLLSVNATEETLTVSSPVTSPIRSTSRDSLTGAVTVFPVPILDNPPVKTRNPSC